MILADQGLFFITIAYDFKARNPRFIFQFSLDEYYFSGNTVKGAFEYDVGKIIIILNG